jgi:hypothetical protein
MMMPRRLNAEVNAGECLDYDDDDDVCVMDAMGFPLTTRE